MLVMQQCFVVLLREGCCLQPSCVCCCFLCRWNHPLRLWYRWQAVVTTGRALLKQPLGSGTPERWVPDCFGRHGTGRAKRGWCLLACLHRRAVVARQRTAHVRCWQQVLAGSLLQ